MRSKSKQKGVFIVFDGIDGSGKSTQSNLLVRDLRRRGFDVVQMDFPQYGTKAAGLIEEYLNGVFGSAESVGPYRASVFFACDRYAASFKIRAALAEGKIVVSDRYIASNIGHQGGKIADVRERRRFIRWLFDFEYGLFGIPRPDVTLILKTTPQLSWKMAPQVSDKIKKAKRAACLGTRKRDIHDRDISHLARALDSYLFAARQFPKEFRVVECMDGGRLLSIEDVWKRVQSTLRSVPALRSRFRDRGMKR